MKELRTGYTTGSAMTAAAVAAYRDISGEVAIRLPGGGSLAVPVARRWPGGAAVVKDGGDDPDVTHGCEVVAELTRSGEDAADFAEPCGEAGVLLIRGGAGVGRVTRPGLAVPPGRPAINPGPRRMLQ